MQWRCAAVVVAWVTALAAVAAAEVVSPDALAQARRDGQVLVVVVLRPSVALAGGHAMAVRREQIAAIQDGCLQGVSPSEITVEHAYEAVNGFAATVSEAGLAQLAQQADVQRIDLDARGHGALGGSVPQIRADRVQARGVAVAGTVVAVLDSGIDEDHPDLADALIHEECFCSPNCCPDGAPRASGPGSAAAGHAHGVHVAGIAMSRGRVAPIGVAPQAQLVAIRVLDNRNAGRLSDWIAALDWIAANRPDVRVVNMSLASTAVFDGECSRNCSGQPLCAENTLFAQVIDLLYEGGAIVFVAAGNNFRSNALTSPACVDGAVAVGAVDPNDRVTRFSNSNSRLAVLAPGEEILSDGLFGGVTVISGTSMATPHVAGVAALLLSAWPEATTTDMVEILQTSGVPIRDDRNGLVVPRVDAFAALHAVTAARELFAGGGSRGSDCLIEWKFAPHTVRRLASRPTVVCSDNDPLCDADTVLGQCTFRLSLCFNVPDPLLRGCAVDEPVLSYTLASPRTDAPLGTAEWLNAFTLTQALPAFPIQGSGGCTAPFSFVVSRPDSEAGNHIRMIAQTPTRRDYDRIALICEAP